MDGMTPIDLLGIPMQDYVDLRFHHADLEGSQIDGFIWDVGDGEDAYALYENEKLPLLDDPGLNRWREQGVDFVGTLVEETRRRGLEVLEQPRGARRSGAAAARPAAYGPGAQELAEGGASRLGAALLVVERALRPVLARPARAKVTVLRELLARYAFDGLQLDFSRHQPTLPIGRQWQHREDATVPTCAACGR